MSVRVRDDGSGVVRVGVVADAEAVKAVESGGAKVEDAVRLSDLADAGWKVGKWVRAPDGSAAIEVSRPFSAVDEVRSIMQEISGPDGPLRGVRITRDSGSFSVDYSSSGRADLENVKTGVPTDPELVASLSGQQVDPNVIDQQLLAQVKASFALKVVIKLPGEKAQTFTPKPGGSVNLDTSSSVVDTDRILFLGAATGFVLLALVVGLRPGRRRRGSAARRQPVTNRDAPPPPPRRR